MGQGTNTKAAILRLGVEEIKTFIMTFFGDLLAVSNVDRADEHSHYVVITVTPQLYVSTRSLRSRKRATWPALVCTIAAGYII